MVSSENLADRVASLALKNERLAQALEKARDKLADMDQRVELLSTPPRSYGIFIAWNNERSADVLVGGRRMNLAVSPDALDLAAGGYVWLSEQLVVLGPAGSPMTGDVVTAKLKLSDARYLVATPQGESVVQIAGCLDIRQIRPGDFLRADMVNGFAYELLERPDVEELLLEETPDVSYADIGGLSSQIEQIKDSVELPFAQPGLYREHGLKPPKGVLLYGPPGCGKTLIAKAVASSLAREGSRPYFLNIKGPQLLDKYVGETERQIRDIFGRARERASSGDPVVIFFDEMEALFRTRGSGVSSDVETTVVPQLLSEIDGVETLDNVIVIGASNREDMIDPAILRPGRLDIKIRIERPGYDGALDIFSKYLTDDLPIHPDEVDAHGSISNAVDAMISLVTDAMFRRDATTEYVELTYADGTRETLYVSDFVSGAMIAALVDRAKKNAIKDLLATGVKGISTDHLLDALEQETSENIDMAVVANPAQWAKVTGHVRSKRITHVRPLTGPGAASTDSQPRGDLQ